MNHYSRAGEWGLVLAAWAGGAKRVSFCPESIFSWQILLSLDDYRLAPGFASQNL
jgi:hypothetical protein